MNVVLSFATQNEIDLDDAKKLYENKIMMIAEGTNMPSTNEAADFFIETN
ncbi:hypothetical protein [Acholeplasma palmae]